MVPPSPRLLLRLWLLCGLTLGLLPLYTEELRPCCGAASALLQPYFSTTLSLLPPTTRVTQLLLTPWLLSSCSRVTPPLLSHGSGPAPLIQGYLWGGGPYTGLTRPLLLAYLVLLSLHVPYSRVTRGCHYTGLTQPFVWGYLVLYHYLDLTPGLLSPLSTRFLLPLLSSHVLTTQPFL